MNLRTRANLAWIPLAAWCLAAAWIGWTEASRWKGDDVQDWIVLAFGGVFLFAGGAWNLWLLRARWARRARDEGPEVDIPVTWHRKSGSWAVIVFMAGVFGVFGLVWLISGQIR